MIVINLLTVNVDVAELFNDIYGYIYISTTWQNELQSVISVHM
jgi:hypothetical protein